MPDDTAYQNPQYSEAQIFPHQVEYSLLHITGIRPRARILTNDASGISRRQCFVIPAFPADRFKNKNVTCLTSQHL